MEKLDTMMLADDLALSQDKILNGEQDFDAEAVYKVIDNLGVLNNPIKDYFNMTEEQYYEAESDHKLTLIKLSDKLTSLHDRILTNPYEDDMYNPATDYRVIVYSLKVIGAVQAIAARDLQEVLSKDAVLSIGLAAYALAHNA